MTFYIGDKYLDQFDSDFMQCALADIQGFVDHKVENTSHSDSFVVSVLCFPLLNGYQRYLLHACVNQYFHSFLATFSVGEDDQRRLVVCRSDALLRAIRSEDFDIDKKIFITGSPLPPGALAGAEPSPSSYTSGAVQDPKRDSNRKKREPRGVYIPPAARRNGNSGTKSAVGATEVIPSGVKNMNEMTIPGSFIDNCNLSVAQQREVILTLGPKVLVTPPKFSYSMYHPETINEDSTSSNVESGEVVSLSAFDYSHILVAQQLPASIRGDRLDSILRVEMQLANLNVKWFADDGAFVVFAAADAAHRAQHSHHPTLKLVTIDCAVAGTLATAHRFKEHLLPYKVRPRTNVQFAQRFINTHLKPKPDRSSDRHRETQRRQDNSNVGTLHGECFFKNVVSYPNLFSELRDVYSRTKVTIYYSTFHNEYEEQICASTLNSSCEFALHCEDCNV